MSETAWTLRCGDTADIDRLVSFYAQIFRSSVGVWVNSLLSGAHPTVSPKDFIVMEDARTGAVAGSLGLIRQVWMYDDVPLKVAQVECVATAAEHRGEGVMRAALEWFASQAQSHGCSVGCVQGVPAPYQHFGFHFAVDLKGGVRLTPGQCAVESCGADYRLAELTDVEDLVQLHNAVCRFLVIRSATNPALWVYQERQPPESERAMETLVHRAGGQVRSYVRLRRHSRRPGLLVTDLGARSYSDWLTALNYAVNLARERREPMVVLQMPRNHFATRLARAWGGQEISPYAWQLRVWDWPAFFAIIASVLERRLRDSALQDVSADLAIQVADERRGVILRFNRGTFVCAESVAREGAWKWDLVTTSRSLVALVFGYRSLGDIETQFLEVQSLPASRVLLEQLFPRVNGFVYEAY